MKAGSLHHDSTVDPVYAKIWCSYAFKFFRLHVDEVQNDNPKCSLIFAMSSDTPIDKHRFTKLTDVVMPGFLALEGARII